MYRKYFIEYRISCLKIMYIILLSYLDKKTTALWYVCAGIVIKFAVNNVELQTS